MNPRNQVRIGEVKMLLTAPDPTDAIRAQLNAYFVASGEATRTVLGVDIYRYSRYEPEVQRLIPVLFRIIYDATIADLRTRESLLFSKSSEEYQRDFIPTGDGGFQVLATPLHAITFALFFETQLQWFNSYVTLPRAREMVGSLTVRWAITHDLLFRFDDNFFGSAIITNARLLSKDRLNRCLLDANVIEWFQKKMGSIESLEPRDVRDIHDLLSIPLQPSGSSILFQPPQPFRTIVAQKIGSTETKGESFDVYSLFVQARIEHPQSEKRSDPRNLVVSLGNLNAGGLAT